MSIYVQISMVIRRFFHNIYIIQHYEFLLYILKALALCKLSARTLKVSFVTTVDSRYLDLAYLE